MKIIFLDIDGVLNSNRYDRERTETQGNIDKTRLPLLKRIVDATSAKIVLISSWRSHWDKNSEKCDGVGKQLNAVFEEAGLEIFDKTGFSACRCDEIKAWLTQNPSVTSFVVIDDSFGGWGDLAPHLVKTDMRIGRGLEENHADSAIKILN